MLKQMSFAFPMSFVLPMFCALSGMAQQGGAFISPVPGVTAGYEVPLDSPQFVYVGPNIKQLTISYPSSLDGETSVRRISFTVPKLDQVRPVFSSFVSPTADGVLDYEYAVKAERSAIDPIAVWTIGLPGIEPSLSASHESWTSNEEVVAKEQPLRDTVSMGIVSLRTWHAPEGKGLGPNSSALGFHLKSRYLPASRTFILAQLKITPFQIRCRRRSNLNWKSSGSATG